MKYSIHLLYMLFVLLSFGWGQATPFKIKTKPDFPEGLPPVSIFFDGVQVGTTNPGGTFQVDLPLDKEKRILKVEDTEVALWKSGMRIKGEVLSGKAKINKGPTLVISTKNEPDAVLAKALSFWPVIVEGLSEADLTLDKKMYFNRLKSKILNYEFTTSDVIANIIGSDAANDLVFLEFSYFGVDEITWQDTLKLGVENFRGRKPGAGKRVAVLVEHFKKIPKVGTLKFSRDGTVRLASVKTEKYKWGTYKKKGKKKKKHIEPMVFFVK